MQSIGIDNCSSDLIEAVGTGSPHVFEFLYPQRLY